MNEYTRMKIKEPLIHHYLQENSYQYKKLYRDDNAIKEIEKLAKEYYHMRTIDKIERLQSKIGMIQTILDVIQ